jgi:hypothetical protein
MSYTDTAIEALRQAETRLQRIIEEALASEAYGDVATVARTAEALAHVIHDVAGGHVPTGNGASKPASPTPAEATATDHSLPQQSVATGEVTVIADDHARYIAPRTALRQAAKAQSSRPTAKRESYPQYFRDGDRLVKVAWSKRERRPYEHRAPREVVQRLVERILARYKHVSDSKPFESAQVMPLSAANGEEYPSYQAYLALGWLRHVGIVAKKGREGYLFKRSNSTPEKLDMLWDSTPTVE